MAWHGRRGCAPHNLAPPWYTQLPARLSQTLSECLCGPMEIARPEIDEQLVQTLEALAHRLDGCHPSEGEPLLEEFNHLAGTEEKLENFHRIYGVCEYDEHVRSLLAATAARPDPTLTRGQLISAFSRIADNPTDDVYVFYALAVIEKTFNDPTVSDVVFWPDQYADDLPPEPTVEEMADAVLKKAGVVG